MLMNRSKYELAHGFRVAATAYCYLGFGEEPLAPQWMSFSQPMGIARVTVDCIFDIVA